MKHSHTAEGIIRTARAGKIPGTAWGKMRGMHAIPENVWYAREVKRNACRKTACVARVRVCAPQRTQILPMMRTDP